MWSKEKTWSAARHKQITACCLTIKIMREVGGVGENEKDGQKNIKARKISKRENERREDKRVKWGDKEGKEEQRRGKKQKK